MKTESSSSYSSHQVSTSSSNNTSSSNSNNNNSSSSSSSKALQEFGTSRVPLTLRDFFFQDPFFKNSWEDFEKIQKEMMRQSQEFWAKVRQDNSNFFSKDMSLTSMDSDNKFFEQDMDMMPMFTPRRWMMPRLVKFEDSDKMFPADFFHFKNFKEEDQVLRVKDEDGKFELSLDTHQYRPDEIKVNVHGNTLSVEAKHEEKSDGKFVSRQFSRKYTLPEGCEGHKVTSNLSSDGILMVTAPKRAAIKVDSGARPVPIEMKK